MSSYLIISSERAKLILLFGVVFLSLSLNGQVQYHLKLNEVKPIIDLKSSFIERKPDQRLVEMDSGKHYLEGGYYLIALKHFKNHISEYPNSSEALFYLGIGSLFIKQYDSAMYYFNKSLLNNRYQPVAIYYKGFIYLQMKLYKEASIEFDGLIRADESAFLGYFGQAMLALHENNIEQSKTFLRKSINLNNQFAESKLQLAYLLILPDFRKFEVTPSKTSIKKSLILIDEVIDQFPENLWAKYLRMKIVCEILSKCEEVTDLAYEFIDSNEELGRMLFFVVKEEYSKENFQNAKDILFNNLPDSDPKYIMMTELFDCFSRWEEGLSSIEIMEINQLLVIIYLDNMLFFENYLNQSSINSARIAYFISKYYSQRNDQNSSNQWLLQAYQSEPTDCSIAYAMAAQKSGKEGLAMIDTALNFCRYNRNLLFLKIEIHQKLRDYEACLSDIQIYESRIGSDRAIDDKKEECHAILAESYFKYGDYERALFHLNAVREKLNYAHMMMANCNIYLQRFEEAKRILNNLERAYSRDANYFNNRGICYYYLNDHGSANYDFEKSVSLNPRLSSAYYYLGLIRLATDKNEAIKYLKKSADLGFNEAVNKLRDLGY